MNALKDEVSRYLRSLHPNKKKSEIQGAVFLYYHLWAKRICIQAGGNKKYKQLWKKANKDEVLNNGLPTLVDELINSWKNKEPNNFEKQCFDAIIVDEGQDFRRNWWSNLRKLLKKDGEIILASDPTQDLYGTASAWTDEAMSGAGFSGSWAELTGNHRMPRELHLKANDFAQKFLSDAKQKIIYEPEEDLFNRNSEDCFLKWRQTDPDKQIDIIVSEILKMPKISLKLGGSVKPLSNADIVFLTPEKNSGSIITQRLKDLKFDVQSVFSKDKDSNRREKLGFYKGSGRIKGSTIHSYKGLGSKALVILIERSNDPLFLNAIYVALTRLKASPEGSFLTVVCSDPRFSDFGENWKGKAYVRQRNPEEAIEVDQTGIDYDYLFSECLEGAKEITLTDPYIVNKHQFFLLQKLLETCQESQENVKNLSFHLVTGLAAKDAILSEAQQNKAFGVIKEIAKHNNIKFTFERTNGLHDRSLKTDHGWNIKLGRGVDMFKPWREGDQMPKDELKLRKSRGTEITYVLREV